MPAEYYEVHAFTDRLHRGNPAGVCLLEEWWPDKTLQTVAAENNLSETANVVPEPEGFGLRWFTPTIEVDLCGHATLASAHVLLRHREEAGPLRFFTRSGELTVAADGERLVLDFPSQPAKAIATPEALIRGLGSDPLATLKASRDHLAVLKTEEEVRRLTPDFAALAELDGLGVIVTAPGEEVDFVSRFFAPKAGIDEDPVTGSAHCTLMPYWAEKLGRTRLTARQVSARGGDLWCELRGDRVGIGGQAVTYLSGRIHAGK